MEQRHAHAVILAGGGGTRLWPLSRQAMPKQFLYLKDGKSLLERTLARVEPLFSQDRILVLTGQEHAFGQAYRLLQHYNALLEPVPRNTGPAIAIAAAHLCDFHHDPVMVVFPSDHVIRDEPAFHRSVIQAIDLADGGKLITLGIQAHHASTGFGYLLVDRIGPCDGEPQRVLQFVEKPDRQTASALLEGENCYWNAGIFAWRASRILEQVERHHPEMFAIVSKIRERWQGGEESAVVLRDLFSSFPDVSIDKGVLEKVSSLWTLPCDMGWADVGSWDAVHEAGKKDDDHNVISGQVVALNTHNSLLHSEGRLLAALGVDNVCVIETPDAVLVVKRGQTQHVGELVNLLQQRHAPESLHHTLVRRPWGSYTVLEDGARGYKIKKIEVIPGGALSLQSHQHRSEHWVVVSGTATVIRDDEMLTVSKNESTYIRIGQTHRLENRGRLPLRLIEVQVGDYLGEDDILRYQDDYGRGESL